jgi:hypothetical protein
MQGGPRQRTYKENLKLRQMTGNSLKVEKGIKPVTKSPTINPNGRGLQGYQLCGFGGPYQETPIKWESGKVD